MGDIAAILGVLIAALGIGIGTRPTHGTLTTGTPSTPVLRHHEFQVKEFVVPPTISAGFFVFLSLPGLIVGLANDPSYFIPLAVFLAVLLLFAVSYAILGWVIGFFLNLAALLVGRLAFHDFSVITPRIATIGGAAFTGALLGLSEFPSNIGFTTPGLPILGLGITVFAAMSIFR